MAAVFVPLALCAETYVWSGGEKGKWESAKNWEPYGVPGRLDTVKLASEAMIDLGRDQMVSNIVFSAKVILAGGAVHVQNTYGRGAKGKLGVRAYSLLGKLTLKDGAVVQPLRGKAGYKGELETSAKGIVRVIETRPAASYVWTGKGGDDRWDNVKNWSVGERPALETPVNTDAVRIPKSCKEIQLPWGVTVVSNLVMDSVVTWKRERREVVALDGEDAADSNAELPCLDVWDLAGNEKFVVRGEVQFCAKGAWNATVPIVAEKGTRLALAAHNHVPYKDVTIEDGAVLMPFDYAVEFERLTLKPGHELRFGPPRHFNRWRPVWIMHAKNLEGKPEMPKIPGWHSHLEKFGDGSDLIAIGFGE